MTASLVALLLLIVIGLVICSALFSGLETALFALRAHQLRRLESNYPALAGFLQQHPLVARFDPAPPDQGGGGVTVVELKD